MTLQRITLAGLVVAAVLGATTFLWPETTTPEPGDAGRPETSAGSPPAPNILIIVTDDQRADHTLGVMPEVRRWFAEEGVRYSQAFATTPLCCPSRASIFTGQYAHNHGVINNTLAPRLDHATTLQHYLKDRGYITGLFGKFMNSWDIRRSPPGFDRWALMDNGYYGAHFNLQGRMKRVTGYSTDFIADQIAAYIEEVEGQDETPWFAYVAVHAVHTGFESSQKYIKASVPVWRGNPAQSESDKSDKPPYVRRANRSPSYADEIRKNQLRALMSVDDLVGRVFRSLQRRGESRSTLAIFMSDNGFLWGEHGLTDKRLPYVQSVRIPLLLRWPGHVTQTVDSRLVANVDIAPTIFDAVGIEPDHIVDGRSLLGNAHRKELLLEYMSDPGYAVPSWVALHTNDRQYAEYYSKGHVSFRELYELSEDRWQLENVLETDSGSAAGLEVRLQRLRSCSGTEGSQACP
jgi:arylsulfatase A-like enzyme